MNPTNTPFTAIYAQWLESFRAMIPRGRPSGPSEELTLKQDRPRPNRSGKTKGGSIKRQTETKPGPSRRPKIPF